MEPQRLGEEIASAQAGSASGFEALLAAYGPRLFGYFFRATGNHHDAEDLLSEMALRLVRVMEQYDHRGKFEPWLFRIAANLVRDRIRRIKTNPGAMSLSVDDGSGTTPADNLPASPQPVDKRLMHAEDQRRLSAAMDKLDDSTRQMIVLRHFGDMSFKEIAEICQCPLGTVLAKVHRGLKTLRRLMDGDDYGPE